MFHWCITKLLEIVGIQEALPIEKAPTRKSPSPPPKKVKLEEEIPPNFTLPLHDATIDEGSRFTFECRATGVPKPEISWLKDNISIESNLDYHTRVEEDGTCSLTIDETFTEDSACFSCRATNILGYAETTALLTVRENERECPPIFVRLLTPTTLKEESAGTLVCKVEGTPLPTVQWYKDGVCVDSVAEYTTTYNNGEAVLSMGCVRREDQGEFSCRATNRLGTETTAANLTVEPIISEKAPVFVSPLSNIMARAGQKIRLECELTGVPEPQLVWTHNSKLLPDTRDAKIQKEGGRVILTIAEAFPKDAGTYSLIASNTAGSVTCSCSVAVKGRLPTETSDSELASDLEPSKPTIPTSLRDCAVFEGGRARLECVIIGQPEPEVIWYHEGTPVKESKEVQLLFQGDRCCLVIAEALLEDAGGYKVVAINSAGEASSTCHLTVRKPGVEEVPPTAPVSELEPSEGIKPLFISLLTDALATEGDSVTLECAVRGDPAPTVSWSLNNHPLPLSDRIQAKQEVSGLCLLVISPVTAEDKGVYTARAANSLGEAKCFAHLIVKSAANLPTTTPTSEVQPEERTSIPAFTELFADRSVVDGNSTKFECIVTGKPTPKVRWLFNDEPVSGKDFLPSVSGCRQVLTLPTVSQALSGGRVTCVADNEAGRASCSALLTVSDAPPVDDLLSTIDQMNLSEMSVFELKREVFMQSTTHSQFGDGEPQVQVHGVASRTEQTSKQLGNQPAVQTESQKTSEYHNVSGIEEKVDTQSHSTTVAPAGAVVPARPQRKQVAPRFTCPLMGKIVDQGVDVTLECIVEGYPTPSISWKKNGMELSAEGRVRVSCDLNKARCVVAGVSPEDTGKYTCTAVNPCGSASCTADLVVKKNVFPPVFGKRLRADTVEAGRRTVLEVEVTGTPDPTVTWYKDGSQIASSSSMFRVLAQGNSHRLIIEQAGLSHSGRYEVRAVNGGGEARTSADLLIMEPAEITTIKPVGVEMDLPEPSEFPSSQQLVSVTESFQSNKKVSINVQQSSAALDPCLELLSINIKAENEPEKTVDEVTNSSIKHESKVIAFEKTQEVVPAKKEEVLPLLEESVIEDSSISKKSALSFFENIIKEQEEESKVPMFTELPKKLDIPKPLPTFQPIPPPVSYESPLQDLVTSSQHDYKEFSQTVESQSICMSDGLVLQPEPPPEMGFISKSLVTKSKEEISEKAKKLEESHRSLPQEQIPSGAVRIFPAPVQKKSESVSTEKSFQQESFVQPITPTPIIDSGNFQDKTYESCISTTQEQPVTYNSTPFKVAKFEIPKQTPTETPPDPPQQTHVMETFTSYKSNDYKCETLNEGGFVIPQTESLPIIRPSADIQLRPQSPRPSAEGVNMEKLWASKQKEEYVEFPHSSPLPFQHQEENLQNFQSEKISTFSEIKHTASPVPSTTGLAMEKLWTPAKDNQKSLLPPCVTERPKSPSADGLAMDKLWAHKSSTQKKVWPPPPEEEDKQTLPPWSNKGTDILPPISSSDASEMFEKESFIKNNVTFESETFSRTESSFSQSSNIKEFVTNTGSAFKEPIKSVKPNIPPPILPPESKIIYVAEAHASHSTNIPAAPQVLTTQTNFMTSSQTMEKFEQVMTNSAVVEEKVLRPSEAVKMWPPIMKEEKQEFKMSPQKQEFQSSFQKQELNKEFSSAIASDSVFDDIPLEPGPPPEIGFAEPPPRRQSYVEIIEQDLEKDIEKVPSRHLAGAVRIIPPPPNKEQSVITSTVSKTKSTKIKAPVQEKKPYVPECITKPLPNLEPFPYTPDPPKSKPAKCPPPPRPSKFVKGSFTESDYESDCDAIRIPVKWNPWQSDSEEYSYRKVKPPSAVSPTKRPHSAIGHAVPPSEFEKPPPLQGPSKHTPLPPTTISKSSKNKIIKTEEFLERSFIKESKSTQHKVPVLKPGSPPKYEEAPVPRHKPTCAKPGSPKTKPKNVQPAPPDSGYMADTDEPSQQHKITTRMEESLVTRTEQSVSYEQSRSEKKILSSTPQTKISSKKESFKTEAQSSFQRQDEPSLEPFPFKPEPVRPAKRPMGPPPPSPSKFIKGEFRESDYESEYEGKIRPIWHPNDVPEDVTFRPVRPVLTPVSGRSQNLGRTPTPPTEFEQPPSFNGPPRPKFEPIDKPKPATKIKEAIVEKTKIVRPKPVQPQIPSPMETIYATPASKSAPQFSLKPGSPPKMDYAPPPGYVEKSNIVNFTESTASSKRVVSVQQTTRVMQFDNSSKKQVQRKENIPPAKVISLYSKESDYESDVDGAVIRTPYIDAEKKRLKRVEEMKKRFLESEPVLQPGEPPEFAYSPDPSKFAYKAASRQMSDMTQTFKDKTQKFVSDVITDIKSNHQNSTNDKTILKPPADEPQTYRDENRLSEFAVSVGGRDDGPQVIRAVSPGDLPKKAPLFITPLRDIACVSGHPARFECIVLAEPAPSIEWAKDGSALHPSPDHQMEYRNGVCRLFLPQARPYNVGQYSCSASNCQGRATTSASLQVPGERRSLYQ